MNDSEIVLQKLITSAARKHVIRSLVCATCGGDCELEAGLMWCRRGRHVFETLAELAVKNV